MSRDESIVQDIRFRIVVVLFVVFFLLLILSAP